MTDIIVGLDIGTSFVRVAIGVINEVNAIEIIGVAKKESRGLRNGVIVNIEATMDCIKAVIEEAEQKAGWEVSSCIVGIGGRQIESMNAKGMVAISPGKGDREITQADVERVLEAANAVQIPMDRQRLHIIPQEYIVDGMPGCKDPIHMIAVRLEAEVHIVTASRTAIQNMTSCLSRAGYERDRVMLKTLACAEAVMLAEEKELGSILIDLGGGTTDVLVILHDAPICTASIPVGGSLVTNDIALVKGIPVATAENIKVTSGCCWEGALDKDEEVLIPGIAGRDPEQTTKSELCQIIRPRMEEIFTMVRDEVVRSTNVRQLSGSVILTGGGALMSGAVALAQYVFGTSSVRIGAPSKLGGIEEEYRTADYATAVGLVVANKTPVVEKPTRKERRHADGGDGREGDSFLRKLKRMFF